MSVRSPYNGGITREQFLFYEMRTTAKLLSEGLSDEEIMENVANENLFQFPTERMIKNITRVCLRRLHAFGDETMVNAIANQPFDVSKQLCLYAMMKDNLLVWDFMVTVIGEKYRSLDMSFSKSEVNSFLRRLQEQDDKAATWSEETIKKIRSVLTSILVENDYLANARSDTLNPVLIEPILEDYIRENNELPALRAFNCLN